MKLDKKTTQEIADELSQRLEDVSIGISKPIYRIDLWLIAIANTALNGLPIVGRGIEVSNKRRNAQTKVFREALIKNEQIAAKTKSIDKSIAAAKAISELTDGELAKFIAKVRDIKHIQKNMPEAIRLLQNRELPNSPLERAAVVEIAIQYF